jgi:hypothetical protein
VWRKQHKTKYKQYRVAAHMGPESRKGTLRGDQPVKARTKLRARIEKKQKKECTFAKTEKNPQKCVSVETNNNFQQNL